jgi:hypothetical protein
MRMAEHPELSAQERAGKAFPVSWDQFHRDCRALTWRLNEVGPFHAVIAITRGGLVPAAIVARELGVRVIDTVCIASYDHTKQGDLKVLKGVSADTAKLGGGTGKGLLIVDDLVDTGKTGGWCATCCRTRISRPSTPSRWDGRWSTPSSPKCRRTPGSFSLGYRAVVPAADPRRRGVTFFRHSSAKQSMRRGISRIGEMDCVALPRNDEGAGNCEHELVADAAAKPRHANGRHHRRRRIAACSPAIAASSTIPRRRP